MHRCAVAGKARQGEREETGRERRPPEAGRERRERRQGGRERRAPEPEARQP